MQPFISTTQRYVGFCKEIRRALLTVLLSGVCVIYAAAAVADPSPEAAGGPLPWEHVGLGKFDPGGVRAKLADHGVTFMMLYDFHAQYNATGGIDTGWGWESRLVPEINVQLEPLLGLKGTEFFVSGAWNVGEDINEKVGALLTPDTAFRETAVRLYELYVGQYLIDKQVHIKVGRLGLGVFEYCYSSLMFDFISAGYKSNPGGIFVNQPVTSYAFPIATWGARMVIAPEDEDFSLRMGVYNGWPRDLADADKNGVDFSLGLDKSTFLIGEFAYRLNQDPEDQGWPGNYKIGVMYDTYSFERFDQLGEETRGNFGFYVIGDQMLWRESVQDHPPDHPANWKVGFKQSHPTTQGLYGWANFIMNPDEEINLAPYWVSAGLTYKGLFPGREADRLGIGFYHAFMSSDTRLDDETNIAAFYRYQFTPWLSFGPDIQYIINPVLSGGGDNALMLGLNLSALL